MEEASGYKVLVDPDTERILGARLLGPNADELVNRFAMAMRCGMTSPEIKKTMIADPPIAVVSKADPEGGTVTDLVAEVCANRSLFTSPEDAAGWLKAYPHGEVIPVTDAFEILRRAVAELGSTRTPVPLLITVRR